MSNPTPAGRPRMPFTLLMLASLLCLKAVLLVTAVAGSSLDGLRPVLGLVSIPSVVSFVRTTPAATTGLLAVAALLVASAVGLLLGRRTGWLLAMVMTGLFVAVDIYAYLNGGANDLWMALNIITVFYLNQRDVREIVGATTDIASDDTVPA
jgi:hypothetical protein